MRREGSDGTWSTFNLSVGSPPQVVRVLPSTSIAAVLLVSQEGCNATGHPPDCAQIRGGLFDADSSSTWTPNDHAEMSFGSLNVEVDPLLDDYGIDKIEALTTGNDAIADSNTIIGTCNSNEIPLGLFGLQDGNIDVNGTQVAGLLQSLKDAGEIESLSWGYTAGAYYQAQQSVGSLSLGGYDTLRSGADILTIPFAEGQSRQLVARLQGVESGSFSLLQEPINVSIGMARIET
jgi:hypothetical protein